MIAAVETMLICLSARSYGKAESRKPQIDSVLFTLERFDLWLLRKLLLKT